MLNAINANKGSPPLAFGLALVLAIYLLTKKVDVLNMDIESVLETVSPDQRAYARAILTDEDARASLIKEMSSFAA